MGFSTAKAHTIVETAVAIVAGDLDLESLEHLDDRAAIERLTSLRGVGRWTAEYVMLRGLGRLHVFPGDDVGARNKLKRFLDIERPLDYESIARLLERCHPYAGIVSTALPRKARCSRCPTAAPRTGTGTCRRRARSTAEMARSHSQWLSACSCERPYRIATRRRPLG